MIVMAIFGVAVLVLTAQRYFSPRNGEVWHVLTATLSVVAAVLVCMENRDYNGVRVVLLCYGIWGAAEVLQITYHALLAAGDLLRLIVQRNTRR